MAAAILAASVLLPPLCHPDTPDLRDGETGREGVAHAQTVYNPGMDKSPPKKARRPKPVKKPTEEDTLADIIVLRGIVKRLGADHVIDLVKHFK